jgi:hypothetical protein
LLALAACAGKAPSSAVTHPLAKMPPAPVDGGPPAPPNQTDISRVIGANRADIQKCYQQALLKNDRLTHGKITVRVVIETSGQAKSVDIEGPTEFLSLQPCIKERVGLWSFPQSPEQYGTEFVYLFQGDERPTAAPETGKAATSDPELDPAAVARYVRSQLPRVKECWTRSLRTTPTLAGKVVLHWTIDADGLPFDISVESNTMQASPVPDCIRALIEAWRFPKPSGGHVEISFPFVFKLDD